MSWIDRCCNHIIEVIADWICRLFKLVDPIEISKEDAECIKMLRRRKKEVQK